MAGIRIVARTTAVLILCIGVFSIAWWVFAFGGAILCCLPPDPAGHTSNAERFFYGLLPFCVSVYAFVFVFSRLTRVFERRWRARLTGWIALIIAIPASLVLWFLLRHASEPDEGIARNWNAASRRFDWGNGSVTIPPGFTHVPLQGTDSLVGDFKSPDLAIEIRYDIGEMAGEHGGFGPRQTTVSGSRIFVGDVTHTNTHGKTTRFSKVSFPDAGCANFSLEYKNSNNGALIDQIAQSFRPSNRMPAWLLPLLPGIARTDCRFRFQPLFNR